MPHGMSFVLKLEYKAKEQGKHVIKLDQWYASSKTCNGCKHKVKDTAFVGSHMGLPVMR